MKMNISLSYLYGLLDGQNQACAMSGVAMDVEQTAGNPLFYPSLDRISNDFGYIKGNVQLVCRGVNYLKNRWTDEQAMELLIAIAS